MIKQALDRRAEWGTPILVGFVGAGRMGTGAIAQIGLMKGIRSAVIADLTIERVLRAFELCRYRREDVVVSRPSGLLTNARLRCDVPTDAPITADMVDLIETTTLYHLCAMQDAGAAGPVDAVPAPAPH